MTGRHARLAAVAAVVPAAVELFGLYGAVWWADLAAHAFAGTALYAAVRAAGAGRGRAVGAVLVAAGLWEAAEVAWPGLVGFFGMGGADTITDAAAVAVGAAIPASVAAGAPRAARWALGRAGAVGDAPAARPGRPPAQPAPEVHTPEGDFEPEVAEWFERRYGEDAVRRQVWLGGYRWFCDVVVECGWCTLYVEVENDAGSVRPGFGQAAGYAGTDPNEGLHLVVVPAGHTDEARLDALRREGAFVREFDAGAGEWVPDPGGFFSDAG